MFTSLHRQWKLKTKFINAYKAYTGPSIRSCINLWPFHAFSFRILLCFFCSLPRIRLRYNLYFVDSSHAHAWCAPLKESEKRNDGHGEMEFARLQILNAFSVPSHRIDFISECISEAIFFRWRLMGDPSSEHIICCAWRQLIKTQLAILFWLNMIIIGALVNSRTCFRKRLERAVADVSAEKVVFVRYETRDDERVHAQPKVNKSKKWEEKSRSYRTLPISLYIYSSSAAKRIIDLVTRICNWFESKSLFFCRLEIVSVFSRPHEFKWAHKTCMHLRKLPAVNP